MMENFFVFPFYFCQEKQGQTTKAKSLLFAFFFLLEKSSSRIRYFSVHVLHWKNRILWLWLLTLEK